MLSPNFFNTIFIFPILNLIIAFYKFFLLIKIPGALGLAIIALTVTIRLILQPFFRKQIETTKKMQDMKPHLDKISAKHKKDPKKLQAEQMRLYQEHGINPASGCLIMIIQMPIFIALYNTLSILLNSGSPKTIMAINKVVYFAFLKIDSINPWFLGLNLTWSPTKAAQLVYYLVAVITAVLQYLQINSSMATNPTPAVVPSDKDKSGTEKKTDGEDFQKAMSMQMKFLFPAMIGWASLKLPIGLALYWNIFSIFSIMQYKSQNTLTKNKV